MSSVKLFLTQEVEVNVKSILLLFLNHCGLDF